MKYKISEKYDDEIIKEKIMGPNPIKLQEELLKGCLLPRGATVMDLGSGQGVTSLVLVKEYGFKVFAADLWSNPTDNKRFFDSMGLTSEQIIPLRADATSLPFAEEFFDGVICTDSYNFFGRDRNYLDSHLLPFVKRGGYVYLVIPGMKKDLHDNLPKELLLSWTPEQMDYIHDIPYWENIISGSKEAELIEIRETEGNEELWNDWIKCDNEYAVNDRKTINAGGAKYLDFIEIIMKRK